MSYAAATIPSSAPLRGASISDAMGRFVGHAFRLRGRASRSEYWWWQLINAVVLLIAQVGVPVLVTGQTPEPTVALGPFGSLFYAHFDLPAWAVGDVPSNPIASFALLFAGLWMLATVIPGVSVAARRLHDSNLSGWWALLAIVPVGAVVVLLLAIRRPRAEGARFDE
ncbi:DUF805 domain-containing protein [Microbacterium sp. Sa4CUA7]|uniref:DUF805 domain-containing protein n=1 Tax=Microbacterium pullorum TaxID=2762236 RepID=A0ABR8S1L1_9MICO|nr:DUF805 domain-containing protein [Microbacterium pullorum]MBD7957369.1 DUF805 domain-containing protein [Microbacterium pullorum]